MKKIEYIVMNRYGINQSFWGYHGSSKNMTAANYEMEFAKEDAPPGSIKYRPRELPPEEKGKWGYIYPNFIAAVVISEEIPKPITAPTKTNAPARKKPVKNAKFQ